MPNSTPGDEGSTVSVYIQYLHGWAVWLVDAWWAASGNGQEQLEAHEQDVPHREGVLALQHNKFLASDKINSGKNNAKFCSPKFLWNGIAPRSFEFFFIIWKLFLKRYRQTKWMIDCILLKGYCHEIFHPCLVKTTLPGPHMNRLKQFFVLAKIFAKSMNLCSCWLAT